MTEIIAKICEWTKLFESHPRYVDLLYQGMPNKETFAISLKD